MKSIQLSLLLTSILGLSACISHPAQFFGMQTEYLENDLGVVTECTTQKDRQTGKPLFSPLPKADEKFFWRDNNLPKGTLYFTCEGDKALLPKDCQGNSLTTPQLRRYWKKHDLMVGSVEFDCHNGIPKSYKNH
ncbi:hypothetical protein [Psychrobacter fjordensis]|uniref:hypothetical protein n=1 Tax=Psychrobacter fjordensis TaxID=664424 RepID=UPI00191A21A1|nr:hypothetical protein [Psychrobacter fjordensis]